MNSKISYFLRSGLRLFEPVVCPYCGSKDAAKKDQKMVVTRLYSCVKCHFQFRYPTDSERFNKLFYQSAYAQADGITTDLPTPEGLKKMMDERFGNKNVGLFDELFRILLPARKAVHLVDYGSSWGYMSYQFKQLGYQVQSYEISAPRAAYGNQHLDLQIRTQLKELTAGNDIVFSSHVIEHVPSISVMVSESARLLTTEGLFIAECPNGSASFRAHDPNGFHRGWGLVHPNYLSDEFYQVVFNENPYYITSTPFDLAALNKWDGVSQVTTNTAGAQLLVIAKPNTKISA